MAITSMKAVVVYYKSLTGVLKIISTLFVAVVVGISSYAHFHSHWSYHSRYVEEQERGQDFLHTESDYEDCFQNSKSYPAFLLTNPVPNSPDQSVRSGSFEYGRHNEGDDSDARGYATCPKPIYELILVSASISILALSLLFMLIVNVEHFRNFKFFDILFHSVSAVVLLIGAGVFIYAAIHISEWCNIKARVYYAEYYFYHKLKNSVTISPSGENDNPILVSNGGAPHKIDDHISGLHEATEFHEEVCNLTHLTTEKIWAAALAILTAILYACTAVSIFFFYKKEASTVTPSQKRKESSDSRKKSKERRVRNSLRRSLSSGEEEVVDLDNFVTINVIKQDGKREMAVGANLEDPKQNNNNSPYYNMRV